MLKAFQNEDKINKICIGPSEVIYSCLAENFITASENGTVFSNRFLKNLGCESKGYLVCTIHYKGIRKQVKIHQIIWIAFKGLVPSGMIIDHINRKRTDNRLENLRLVTQKENSKNRRSYNGGNNPAAILCQDEVNEIRSLHRFGFSYADLANAYSISKSLIAAIIRGEVWA